MQRLMQGTLVISLFFCLLALADAGPSASLDSPTVGNWMSERGGFTICFRVSQDEDGCPIAYADIPDQEAWNLPADLTVSNPASVRFDIYNIRCAYEGTISKDGARIDGTFRGPDGGSMPLLLERVDTPPIRTSRRPQEPKRPYPYREEEVVFENRAEKVRLAGTLTLPKEHGPHPAALLVSGSGPNDRDQLIWGHRVFLVLADYLTRQGIVVLRYDDRGVGRSTGNYDNAMFDDFKRDALAGLEYLKARPEVDIERIGLIGHSEGGAIATLVASSAADVAYLVLMAAPGRNDLEGLLKQFADGYRTRGASEKAIAVKCSILRRIFHAVRGEDDLGAAESRVRRVLRQAKPELAKLSEDQRRKIELESVDTYKVDWVLSPSFRSILRYDPREALVKVRCRVLAMNGAKDVQMPVENLQAIGAALEAGGNHAYTLSELAGLNHLFQTATTGSPAEYSRIEETLSPVALEIVSAWILK